MWAKLEAVSKASTTVYELNLAGIKVAQWTENRKGPPPKSFAMIPKPILDQPALKDYSVRATVVTSEKVASGYLVKVQGNRMRTLGLDASREIPSRVDKCPADTSVEHQVVRL